MIQILIADDEPLARENIVMRLANARSFNVCGQADNGHDAFLLATALAPDVVFLDIEMPGLDGIKSAEKIKSSSGAIVVFITAFNQHAVEAFRVNALDYLVKPINDQQFLQMLGRVKKSVHAKRAFETIIQPSSNEKTYLKRLAIKDGRAISMVDVAAIECIESAGDYLCLQVGEKSHIQRQTLTSLKKLLNPDMFLRIHRSNIINLLFLDSLLEDDQGLLAVLKNGRKMRVSRRFQKQVKDHVTEIGKS